MPNLLHYELTKCKMSNKLNKLLHDITLHYNTLHYILLIYFMLI